MTTTEGRSAPGELSGLLPEIQASLTAVVQACHAKGRGDLAGRLQDEVQAQRRRLPSVVVVGEAKRGKSSLVNALVGRVGLSPVDVDIATGSTVVLHWSERPVVRVDAEPAGDGANVPAPRPIEQLTEVPPDTIEDWATVAGNPGNERGVRAVFIGVDSPLLRDLLLIDTPGVGGLDGAHARLAAEAAGQADAVVFVTDGVLADAEVRCLARIRERVQTVVVALTKSDLLDADDIERIRQSNAAILDGAESGLASCAVLPVSSSVANRALRADPPRADLLAESGIAALATTLAGTVGGRAQTLRLANLIRLATTAVDELLSAEREQVIALETDDPDAINALATQQRELDELLSGRAEWTGRLEEGLRLVGLARADDLRAGMREITMRYEEKSFSAAGDQLSGLPAEVLADVAALTTRIAATSAERIDAVVDEIGTTLQAAQGSFDSVDRLRSGAGGEPTLELPGQRGSTRVENLSTLISLSSGRSLGSLVAGLPIFALAGAPFVIAGLGVGAVFAWQMHRGRGETARQQQFRSWLGHQIAETQSQLSTDYERAMIEIRKELRQAVSRWLESRRAAVTAALETHQAGVQRSRRERTDDLDRARQDVTRLEGISARMQAIGGQLAASAVGAAT